MKVATRFSGVVHDTYQTDTSASDLTFGVVCNSIRNFRSWNVEILPDDTDTTCFVCIRISKRPDTKCPKCGYELENNDKNCVISCSTLEEMGIVSDEHCGSCYEDADYNDYIDDMMGQYSPDEISESYGYKSMILNVCCNCYDELGFEHNIRIDYDKRQPIDFWYTIFELYYKFIEDSNNE